MIQLHNDEKIVNAFEVKKSVHGKGVLYITNYGVYFESQQHGMVIEVEFEWLRSYNAIKKNIFQIVWSTQNNERFYYEVEINSTEVIMAYRDANKEYAESLTEIQVLESKHRVESIVQSQNMKPYFRLSENYL